MQLTSSRLHPGLRWPQHELRLSAPGGAFPTPSRALTGSLCQLTAGPARGARQPQAGLRPRAPGVACLTVSPREPWLRVSSPAQVGPHLSWWLWPVARFLPPPESALWLVEHRRAGCLRRLPGEGRGRRLVKGAVGSRRPTLGLFSHLPSQGLCAHKAKPVSFGRKNYASQIVRSVHEMLSRFRGARLGVSEPKPWWRERPCWGVGHPCHVCVLLCRSCTHPWEARCSEAVTPRLLRGPWAERLCGVRPPLG